MNKLLACALVFSFSFAALAQDSNGSGANESQESGKDANGFCGTVPSFLLDVDEDGDFAFGRKKLSMKLIKEMMGVPTETGIRVIMELRIHPEISAEQIKSLVLTLKQNGFPEVFVRPHRE